jgi:hypothetical protein
MQKCTLALAEQKAARQKSSRAERAAASS